MKLKIVFLKILRRIFLWCEDAAISLRIRTSYAIDLIRIRAKNHEKIKIIFLVNETAKWKCQSLYDLLAKSERYAPCVAVSIACFDIKLPKDELRKKVADTVGFFREKGMQVVKLFDDANLDPLPLDPLKPDVVFYQHPWELPEEQLPKNIAYRALTCYVPYYVPNYGDLSTDYWRDLHKQLWCYFTLNKFWQKFLSSSSSMFNHAGKIVSVGHPALDYYFHNKSTTGGNAIIYAPHWSFVHPNHPNFENYGTFCETGEIVLQYAEKHPEFDWIFKPHPTLKFALISSGVMTEEGVKAYWGRWSKVGKICEDGNYQKLFVESRAMITDCASFLIEYFATGKPLIHLISNSTRFKPVEPSRKIFDTFYKVHNKNELFSALSTVIENGVDDKYDDRQRMLAESGIIKSDSAENIKHYLDTVLLIR